MIECEDVRFIYEGRDLLDGVTFSMEKGEVAALLGASGAGKTTLFRYWRGC